LGLSSLNKMNFNYISKNSEETSQLEKAVKSLEDSNCFGVLGGPWDFNVSSEGSSVVLTPIDPKTYLVLHNLHKNEKFKIDSVDIQPSSGKFNLEFYLLDIPYIIKSHNYYD